MKLAKEFRRTDWREFIDGLSRFELHEWLAFFELEGFTEEREDQRTANNFATLMTLFAGSEVEPEHFLYMHAVYREAAGAKTGGGPTMASTKANLRRALGG